jgi:hypothetical protein
MKGCRMDVVKLPEERLTDVLRLIKQVVLDMNQKRIDQWDDFYPGADVLMEDLRGGNSYGLVNGEGKLFGHIVLDEVQSPEYRNVPWKDGGKALMIHRFCTDPVSWNRENFDALISFAERYARSNGYSSLRLDTFRKNKPFLYILESNAFEFRGTVQFRKGEFKCYEKILPVLPQG